MNRIADANLGVMEFLGNYVKKDYAEKLGAKNNTNLEKAKVTQKQYNIGDANVRIMQLFSGLAPPTRVPLISQTDSFFEKNKSRDGNGETIDNAEIFKTRLAKEWVLKQKELEDIITKGKEELEKFNRKETSDTEKFDKMTKTHKIDIDKLTSEHEQKILGMTKEFSEAKQKMDSQIKSLTSDNKEYESKLTQFTNDLQKMSSIESENKKLKLEIEGMNSTDNDRVAGLMSQVNELSEKLKAQASQITNFISTDSTNELLTKKNNELQVEIESQKRKCLDSNSKNNSLDGQIQRLQLEYENYKKTSKAQSDITLQMKESLFDIKMKLMIENMEEESKKPQAELVATNADLTRQLQSETEAKNLVDAKNKSIMEKLTVLQETNQNLASKVDELEKNNSEISSSLSTERASNATLRQENDKTYQAEIEKLRGYEEKLNECKSNLEKCHETTATLHESIKEITELRDACTSLKSQLETTIDANNIAIAEKNTEAQEKNKELEDMRQKQNELNSLKEQRQSEIAVKEAQLAAKETESKAQLAAKETELQEQITILKTSLEEIKKTELKNQENQQELEQAIENVKNESQEINKKNESLAQELSVEKEKSIEIETTLKMLKIKEQFIEDFEKSLKWTIPDSVIEDFKLLQTTSEIPDESLDGLIEFFKNCSWKDGNINFTNVDKEGDTELVNNVVSSVHVSSSISETEHSDETTIRHRNFCTMAHKFLTSFEKEESIKKLNNTISESTLKLEEIIRDKGETESEEILRLKQIIEENETTLSKLEGEKQQLQGGLDEMKYNISKIAELQENILHQNAKYAIALNEAEQQSKTFEKEKLLYQEMIKKNQTTITENEGLIKELQAKNQVEIDRLTQENQDEIDRLTQETKVEIDRLTQENQDEIDRLTKANQVEIDRLTQENQVEIERLTQENQVEIDRLTKANQVEIDRLTQENQTLNEQNNLFQTQIDKMKASLDETYKNLEAQKAEIESLKLKVDGEHIDIDLLDRLENLTEETKTQIKLQENTYKQQIQEANAACDKRIQDSNTACDKRIQEEKAACEEKLQQLQNRELKLAKELLLLKLQLDLEKQIKASSVPSTVTSVAAPTYSNATVSNMFDDLLSQGDLDLKGGSAKQKLIMKGGALSLFDDENYIVIEKEKAEKLKIQLTGYQSRYKTMKEEIENLNEQIKTNASTTPICAFVNKMVNGNNQTELMKKYLKEIVLLKTQYAKNVKELLFEKIANQVNQQIVKASFKSRSATSAPSSASKTSVTSQISPANISSLEGYIKPNIAFVPGNK